MPQKSIWLHKASVANSDHLSGLYHTTRPTALVTERKARRELFRKRLRPNSITLSGSKLVADLLAQARL